MCSNENRDKDMATASAMLTGLTFGVKKHVCSKSSPEIMDHDVLFCLSVSGTHWKDNPSIGCDKRPLLWF